MPHVSSSGGGNSGGTAGGGGGARGGESGPGAGGGGGSVPGASSSASGGGGGNGGDDLGSTDEVKVFKDEGDGEDEKLSSSENLTEEKSSLIDLTESEEKSGGGYSSNKHSSRSDHSHVFGKIEPNTHPSSFNVGYLVGPYGYANGASGPIPVSMAGKMGLGAGVSAGHAAAAVAAEAAARLSFFCHNGGSPGPGGDPLLAAVTAGHHHHHHHHQPPPAHMGIPPYQLVDAKAGSMAGEYHHGHHHHHHQQQQQLAAAAAYHHRVATAAAAAAAAVAAASQGGLVGGSSNSGGGGGGSGAAATQTPPPPPPPPPPGLTLSPTPHHALTAADWRRLGPLLAATSGLTRPPMYPFGTGQYPYPMLSPEMSQVAASWHSPSMYPGLSAASASASAAAAAAAAAAAGFRSPYQPGTTPSGTDFYSRFSPTGLIGPPPPPPPGGHHHAGLSPQGGGGQLNMSGHPAIVTPGPKQELGLGSGLGAATADMNHRYRSQVDHKNNMNNDLKSNQDANNAADKKKPHIKKPLNAFMLYMKEMRAKVVAECTLKESAAINQILGRKWHALGREEQAKYYELARRERQLHMQLYPDWSSRANATRGKKRKRKQDPADGGNSMKKCRARYGLDQQSQWCKPCSPDGTTSLGGIVVGGHNNHGGNVGVTSASQLAHNVAMLQAAATRKKKCIRYMEAGGGSADGNQSDDNLGSCGSMGDAHTPPEEDDDPDHPHSNDPNDDTEEDSMEHRSMSSPGALSALSSLTSPGGGVVLPSPSTSVASPSVSVASPYVMQLQSPLTPHNHDGLSMPLPSPFEALKLLPPPTIGPNYHHRLQHHLTTLHQVHNQTQPQLPHQTTNTTTSPFPATVNNSPPHPHTHLPAIHHHHPALHQLAPQQHQHIPVGANPHDANNPLSVNQLTGQCVVKAEPTDNITTTNTGSTQVVTANGATPQQRSIISVT